MVNATAANTTQGNVTADQGMDERLHAVMGVELTFLCLISIVGVTGNVLIIKNMTKRKGKSSEYFIINLAISDLSVCAVCIPLQIYENMHHTWQYGAFLCKVIWPSQTLLVLVSIMSLTAMSLERHRAIMTPLRSRLKKSFLLKSIACVWAFGFCVVAPYVNFLSYNGVYCAETWSMDTAAYYTLSLFVVDYCIPLTVITFCYTRAGRKLYMNTREFKLISSPSSVSHMAQRKRLRRNKRIIKRFSFAVVVFLLCMLPGDCFWMWRSFGNGSASFTNEAHFRRFTEIAAYANSAINPFIFGACHATCLKVLCRKRHKMQLLRRKPIIKFHSEDTSLNQIENSNGSNINGNNKVKRKNGRRNDGNNEQLVPLSLRPYRLDGLQESRL